MTRGIDFSGEPDAQVALNARVTALGLRQDGAHTTANLLDALADRLDRWRRLLGEPDGYVVVDTHLPMPDAVRSRVFPSPAGAMVYRACFVNPERYEIRPMYVGAAPKAPRTSGDEVSMAADNKNAPAEAGAQPTTVQGVTK